MQTFVYLLKDYGRLWSPAFFLSVFAVGILLLFTRRFAHWGRRWLLVALVGMWLISTPLGSGILSAPLTIGQQHIESVDQARGVQAIVVLGGGTKPHVAEGNSIEDLDASALRVLEGVRLYKLLNGEPLLVFSGGPGRSRPRRSEAGTMGDAAVKLGVSPGKIVLEERSATTRDEAVILKSMFAERHIDRFVLVTSPTHMGRSVSAFRAVGMNPIPSISRLRSDSDRSRWSLIPNRDALDVSDTVIYDAAAWVYYWYRGWLG